MDLLSLRHRRSHMVLLLPHYRVRGKRLYSCLRDTPTELSGPQAALLNRCDGRRTLGALLRTAQDADAALLLLRAAVITTVAPDVSARPAQKWLVFSPHRDDAALSLGGWLPRLRKTVRVVVANVVTRSDSINVRTGPARVRGAAAISRLRAAEEEVAAAVLGVELRDGSLTDATLRRGAVADAAREDFVAEVHRLYTEVAPDRVLAPLGIGDHPDHQLTHEAVVRNVRRWRLARPSLSLAFYEDLPYAFRYPVHLWLRVRDLRLEARMRLQPMLVDIRSTLETKLTALAVYRSQEIFEDYADEILSYARLVGREQAFGRGMPSTGERERVWQVTGFQRTSRGVRRRR